MKRFFALVVLCSLFVWDPSGLWGASSHRLSEQYESARSDATPPLAAVWEHSPAPQVRLTLDEAYRPAPVTVQTSKPPRQETPAAETPPVPETERRKQSFFEGVGDQLAALHNRKPLLYVGSMALLLVLLLAGANTYLKFRMKRAIRRLPWASLRQDVRIQAWPSQGFVRKLRLWDYLKDRPALEKLQEQRREEMKAKKKRKSSPLLLRKYYRRLGEIKTAEEGLYVLKVMTLIGNVKVIGSILDLLDQFPEDGQIHETVVSVLRSIRDARLLRVILPYLSKADPELQGILTEACRSFGDTGAGILVRELEREKDPVVQQGIIKLLGAMGGGKVTSVLSSLLLDGSDSQRLAAADALAAMGTEEVVEPLVNGLCNNPSAEVRAEIRNGLGRIPAAPTVALLTRIVETSPTFYFRTRALEGLEAICSEPGEAFFKALEAGHPKVQSAAAAALARMGAIESTLDHYTKDFDDSQQQFLVTVGKAGAMEPFLAFLRTDDMKALKRVVRLLAMIGNRDVIPRLMKRLERAEDWTVQSRIIPALAVLQATEAVPQILKHLKSTHHWVRKTAIDALGSLVSPISELREQTLGLLHQALIDDDPWTRASAARVLAALEDRTSTPLLINLLDDSQTRVRVEAARALKGFHALQAEEKFIELLDDGRQKVCAMAASALGAFGSEQALPKLIDKFDQAKAMFRLAIIEAVFSIDRSKMDILIEKLRTASRINLKVIRELNRLRTTDTRSLLVSLAKAGDTGIRSEALHGIAGLEGEDVDETILGALSDRDEKIRAAAVNAIALGERQSMAEIVSGMRDDPAPVVRLRVILALGLVKDPEVLPYLRNCLYDQDPQVNAHAIMALFHYAEPRFLEHFLEKFKVAKVRRVLKRMVNTGRDPVVQALTEKIHYSRQVEFMILRDHSLRSLDAFLVEQITEAPTKEEKFKAIMIAELMGRKRMRKPLKQAILADPVAEVRARALRAYSMVTKTSCEKELIQQALEDPALEVQTIASRMLIHCQEETA